MKIALYITVLLITENLFSQTTEQKLAEPFASFSLKIPERKGTCVTNEEIQRINEIANAVRRRWNAKGDSFFEKQNSSRSESEHLLLDWPIRISDKYDFQYKYFYKGNFVDQDTSNNDIYDYNCGNRTYDRHDAMDASLWPFWWRMMDSNYVMAVSTAPGMIIKKRDGQFDRWCFTDTSREESNQIHLLHEDGITTRYHHLKNGGLTAKDSGDYVQKGEFLGYIGSSGNSSHPHIHFAIYDSSNQLVEPFFITNSCNNYSTESWWLNQAPYWDSKVNRVMTHSQQPSIGDCPSQEAVHVKNNFNPGDPLYVGIAFSEYLTNDQATCFITRPDNTLFAQQSMSLQAENNNNYIYKVLGFTLPAANTGTWRIQVVYKNESYFHFFTVGCTSTLTPTGTHTGSNGYIAGSSISSTVLHDINSGDRILYQAPSSILFSPGFHAPAGVILKARLKECNFAE